jgi:hypothetical protein
MLRATALVLLRAAHQRQPRDCHHSKIPSRLAIGAGLRSVGIATSRPADDLLAAGATLVARDFTDEGL